MAQEIDTSTTGTAKDVVDLPAPKIMLRRQGKLELFTGPSKSNEDLRVDEGFPEVDASQTEWSK